MTLIADLSVSLGLFSLNVTLDVRPGETLSLMGPNGAGKTTCLNLIAGLLRPARARVVLGGTVLADTPSGVDLPPEKRSIGYLFQEGALFSHLTVGGNVAYGARARRLPDAEAARWLDRLSLGPLVDRPVSTLSGGQRQRVALARALASGPKLLLLDEPFAALDAASRAAVRSETKRFLKEAGLPAIVVAHDPVDALLMGDRIAVLEGGRVVQTGPELELLARPRTPFVAKLIGLNFFPVDVAAGQGLKEARRGSVVFHVLADALSGPAHLAFAPSDVALSAESPKGSHQNVFPAVVRDVVPLTDRLRVTVDAGIPLTADITREAAQNLHVEPNAKLWASIKATAIRVYP